MRLLKTIKIDMISCILILCITNEIRKAEKYFQKKYNIRYEDKDPEVLSEGWSIGHDSFLYIVAIDSKYLSHNTIAHEIYHITNHIMKDRDILDEESSAWLCGFISEEFYKFLDTARVKKAFDKLTKEQKDGGKESGKSPEHKQR